MPKKKSKNMNLIDNDSEDKTWLKVSESETSEDVVKILSVTMDLNELDFPRLFDITTENLPNILKKIIIHGYESYFPEPTPANSESISNNNTLFNPIFEKLNQLPTKFEAIDGLINKLTGISSNSKKIGIFGENYIQELISKSFIGMSYQKTGETDHSGDGLITLNNGGEILVEVKNYATVVSEEEINKFTFDMKHTKRKLGIFISINSKICKTKIIDLRTFTYENELYYQFFISQLSEDLHRLEVGILFLQLLSEYKNPKNNEIIIDESMKEKLTNLIEQLNENEKLRGYFLDSEKEIRTSLNKFYQKLRDNHMDMENKIKNIFTFLKDNNVSNLPDSKIKQNEYLEKYKSSKIYNILKKILDFIFTKDLTISLTDKEIIINDIGKIKIMKDKLILNTNSKIQITINDYNWDSFEKQFPKT
jgi:hypothetical protein